MSEPTDLAKRLFLMDVRMSDHRLFYSAMSHHLTEFLPIVYAPTVAESILNYSDHHDLSDVAYISVDDPEGIAGALELYAEGRDIRLSDIKLIVATDGEGILGIGDWGANGAEILTGKVAVYTAAAGIDPAQILPVLIDVGTNNAALITDARYVGNRFARVRGEEYDAFIDAFVEVSLELMPGALLHWEDFGRSTAAPILERYRETICTLNDDIQGTGVTMLAALNASMQISGTDAADLRVLVFGAGTAGVGVADQIVDELVFARGMGLAEARSHVYLMDRQGLIVADAGDGAGVGAVAGDDAAADAGVVGAALTEGQQRYARPAGELAVGDPLSLLSVVAAVKPTALIGTSTMFGAFTEEVVREMARHVARPLIAPISNPTQLAEATAADVIRWTDGAALVTTGGPSAPVTHNGIDYVIGQGNNALMYPGICFGALVAGATVINRAMLLEAAHAIADMVDTAQPGAAVLPPFSALPEVSHRVAVAVVRRAIRDGVNTVPIAEADAERAVTAATWHPAEQ